MNTRITGKKSLLALAVCAALLSGNTLAANAGQGQNSQGDSQGRHEQKSEKKSEKKQKSSKHFDNNRREVVQNYYKNRKSDKGCPPGLAKKDNGCLPPGQAKKYELGRNLYANTSYQAVPQDLLYLLGQPPAGQHYGVIDNDILLLANMTELVLEVITGSGQ